MVGRIAFELGKRSARKTGLTLLLGVLLVAAVVVAPLLVHRLADIGSHTYGAGVHRPTLSATHADLVGSTDDPAVCTASFQLVNHDVPATSVSSIHGRGAGCGGSGRFSASVAHMTPDTPYDVTVRYWSASSAELGRGAMELTSLTTDADAVIGFRDGSPPSSGTYGGQHGFLSPSPPFGPYGQFLGHRANYAMDYLGGGCNWEGIDNPGYPLYDWLPYLRTGGQVAFSVALLPGDTPDVAPADQQCNGPGSTQGTLAAGAAGAYDGHWLALATHLDNNAQGQANLGYCNTKLALGWELNGNWFRWGLSASNNGTDIDKNAADYAAYWRRIVWIMRSVQAADVAAGQIPPGCSLKFDWNFNLHGDANTYVEAAYPGDAVVDYISSDVYDSTCDPSIPRDRDNHYTAAPALVWFERTVATHGLNWWATFAAQHNKMMAMPEWGLAKGGLCAWGGDNPYFLQAVRDFVAAHRFGPITYFDVLGTDGIDHRISPYTNADVAFPKSQAAFRRIFGR